MAEEDTSIHVGDPSPGPYFAISTLKTARVLRSNQDKYKNGQSRS